MENERRLTRAQAIGMIGCWEFRLDPEEGHIWASDESFRLFGLTPRSDGVLSLERVETCILERERVHKALLGLIEKGAEYDLEYEIAPADGGRHRIIHSMAELVKDAEGRPAKIMGVIQDVTERHEANKCLDRFNRELLAIKECNRALVKARTVQELLDAICRIVCEVAGYRMAWIGSIENDEARTIRPVAWASYNKEYVVGANTTWAEEERGKGPTGKAIRTGRTACVQDWSSEAETSPWRNSALKHGYRSSIAIPLMSSGRVMGALMIYSSVANGFNPEEIGLLEELAADLTYGMINLRSQEEKRKAEEALRKSEEAYSKLIETRSRILLFRRI